MYRMEKVATQTKVVPSQIKYIKRMGRANGLPLIITDFIIFMQFRKYYN